MPPSGFSGPYGAGGGGAFFLPSFNPYNPSELHVTSDMSGVYRTTNMGASWNLIDWRMLQGSAHHGLVQFTASPAIRYVLDDDDGVAIPSKSTNAGTTWQPIATDPTSGAAFALFADPLDTLRLLIADYTTLYMSSDGGATFSSVFTSNVGGAGCHIAGVYFDSSIILVGTNAGVLASTNGGSSFTVLALTGIPQNEAIVSFCGARLGSVLRLYCVTLNRADVYAGVTGAEHDGYRSVYTIEYGQVGWVPRINGIPSGVHPFHIATARATPSIAYLGGGSSAGSPAVLRTTDGGALWTPVFLTVNNQNIVSGWSGDGGDRGWNYGEYVLGLAVAPGDVQRVAITDLGFVHVTTNGGALWRQAYVHAFAQNPSGSPTPQGRYYLGNGLENVSAWCVAWANDSTSFVGTSDTRGMRSLDYGRIWGFTAAGLTQNTIYHVSRHPLTSTFYASSSTVHDLYQSTHLTDAMIDGGSGRVLSSTGTMSTWTLLHDFGRPVTCTAIDPTNPNRMYAAVVHSTLGGIYRTSDLQNGPAATWTRLPSPPRTQGHPWTVQVLSDGSVVCSYSGRRAGSPLAFTASSGVYLSTDHGQTWIDRSAPGMQYWTKDLYIPGYPSEDVWFAGVFSGWGGGANGLGGLYRSSNRGVSWSRILTTSGVESCIYWNLLPGEMHVATEREGILYTLDCLTTNPTFMQTSFPFRHPLRFFPNPHDYRETWITTFGNGVHVFWDNFIPVTLARFTASARNRDVQLEWRTEHETDNAGFDIQRRPATPAEEEELRADASASSGTLPWQSVGFVPGRGTTTAPQSYTHIDTPPQDHTVWVYRLMQVDMDGSRTASQVVLVTMDVSALSLTIAPYPAREGATLHMTLPEEGAVTVRVHDMLARSVHAEDLGRLVRGTHTLRLDMSAWPSGSYTVSLVTCSGTCMTRLQHVR
jgi:photosystem II stability/assembly factor-like uncharacterized protein